MPELPLCLHCSEPIDKGKDEYVIPNKQTHAESAWVYAHTACHQKQVQEEKDARLKDPLG